MIQNKLCFSLSPIFLPFQFFPTLPFFMCSNRQRALATDHIVYIIIMPSTGSSWNHDHDRRRDHRVLGRRRLFHLSHDRPSRRGAHHHRQSHSRCQSRLPRGRRCPSARGGSGGSARPCALAAPRRCRPRSWPPFPFRCAWRGSRPACGSFRESFPCGCLRCHHRRRYFNRLVSVSKISSFGEGGKGGEKHTTAQR